MGDPKKRAQRRISVRKTAATTFFLGGTKGVPRKGV